MSIDILPIQQNDLQSIRTYAQEVWGSEDIVVHNTIYKISSLSGLKAVLQDEITGFLHYKIRDDACEILTLASFQEGQGIGSALIAAVQELAQDHGCQILHLITTNDNLHALGFYQRRGFCLTHVYPGQVTISRKHKPSIPDIGENGIPIRDEIRLEMRLEPKTGAESES